MNLINKVNQKGSIVKFCEIKHTRDLTHYNNLRLSKSQSCPNLKINRHTFIKKVGNLSVVNVLELKSLYPE